MSNPLITAYRVIVGGVIKVVAPSPLSGDAGDAINSNFKALADSVGTLESNEDAYATALTAHTSRTDNPHATTKDQVGLGNVANVDATNASNITSGTPDPSRLPSQNYLPLAGGSVTGDLSVGGTTSLDQGVITTDGSGNLTLGGGLSVNSLGGGVAVYLGNGPISTSNGVTLDDGGGNFSINGKTSLDGGNISTDGSGSMTFSSTEGILTIAQLQDLQGSLSYDGYGNIIAKSISGKYSQTTDTISEGYDSDNPGGYTISGNLSQTPVLGSAYSWTYRDSYYGVENSNGSGLWSESSQVLSLPLVQVTLSGNTWTAFIVNIENSNFEFDITYCYGDFIPLNVETGLTVGGALVAPMLTTSTITPPSGVNLTLSGPVYCAGGLQSGGNTALGTTTLGTTTINSTNNATSGTQYGLAINRYYNQTTGSAANTDLYINRTQVHVGSGAQYLINAAVGSTSKFSVDNVGNVAIQTLTVKPLSSAPSSPTEGMLYWDSGSHLLKVYDGTGWKAVTAS